MSNYLELFRHEAVKPARTSFRDPRRRQGPAAALVALLLLAGATLAGAEDLPSLRPSDAFPATWTETTIAWKGTWDETLAANYDEGAWKQAIAANPELQEAADRIVAVKRIRFLEEMIRHFPDATDQRLAACRTISDLYAGLGDRTRAAQWMKRLAEDVPGRPELAVQAYTNILHYADAPDAMPAARDWVAYATRGIADLEKAGALPPTAPAVLLGQQRTLGVFMQTGRYEEARRYLDRLGPSQGSGAERAAPLLAAAGSLLQAAELYVAAGQTNQARALRAEVRPVNLEGVGKYPTRDLEMRLQALQAKNRAGDLALGEPTLSQETLKLCSDGAAMWNESPSHRVQCWISVDQTLRTMEPAGLLALRELQERTAGPLVEELDLIADEAEMDRLARLYPWAASTHERLIDYGELCLRNGRYGRALRAFQDAATHTADPALSVQARVGSWLALSEAGEPREVLEAAMSAVPDDALLPWRGSSVPAALVKQAIRPAGQAGAGGLNALSALRRLKLQLPAALASDDPRPMGPWPTARRLGPWAVSRIEPAGDRLYILGPRRAACFSTDTLALRWARQANTGLDMPSDDRASDAQPEIPDPDRQNGDSDDGEPARAPTVEEGGASLWPQAAQRTITLGSTRSRAVAERSAPAVGGAAPSGMLYSLLFHNAPRGLLYDVVAYDAQSGQTRWHTRERPEWSGLEPLCEPATAEGRVYVLACATVTAPTYALYLACLNGQTGETIWKAKLGVASVRPEIRELARGGCGVTVREMGVYAATSLGLIARCDAGDGTVQWVQTYASALQPKRLQEQFQREGTSPLIARDRVFVAPRDHSGVMALDRITGRLLWESILTPSGEILGASGDILILRGGNELSAADVATGKELWTRAVDESTGAPSFVSGTNVFLVSHTRIERVAAATGATVEELSLDNAPGTERLLLPDGALVEVSQEAERTPEPGARAEGASGPPQVPLVEDWALGFPNPALVTPVAGNGPTNTFGALSGRSFVCVQTQPRCALAWRALLTDGADSIGFHGRRVLVARGRVLTALDGATGATLWSLEVPFDPNVAGGDDRVLFAGELSTEAKVAAIDPATGRMLWLRWFGQEPRFGKGPLGWISLRLDPAQPPALLLYWQTALFGKEGWKPAEVVVDASSGTLQEVRAFPANEKPWPGLSVLAACGRTYLRDPPALVAAGEKREFPFPLPGEAGEKATRKLLASWERADALTAVSVEPPPPPSIDSRLYTHAGLKDETGNGDVTLKFFEGRGAAAQVYMTALKGLPEAGTSPVATLLDGGGIEAYYGQKLSMSNINSLGWAKYDVFMYGPIASATMNGTNQQTCQGWDSNNPAHRTTFIRGVNYIKFAGMTGDAFSVDYTMSPISGIQLVDASAGTGLVRKAACLGIAWNGSRGGGPKPSDHVGAEVAGRCWYVIRPIRPNHYYSKTYITGGYQNPFILIDVFDRTTRASKEAQKIPFAPGYDRLTGCTSQAKLLDGALVVTDTRGIRVFRSAPPPPVTPPPPPPPQ
jgi:outer membrane protein assembly factor BamB/tetratricopeptide (TPR) repeat protein